MEKNVKYGFVGAGNMASALIRGAVRSTLIPPDRIEVYDIDEDKPNALKTELAVDISLNISRLVSDCDCIVIAVKPNVLPGVLRQMSGALSIKKPPLISIAAGQSLSKLQELAGFELPIIRVMPNLNAAVGESISAYCCNDLVDEETKDAAVNLLRCSGETIELPEKLFPVFDAVGGASPAFCFMFADAMARAAVKNGMARFDAQRIVYKAIEGSIKFLRESGEHPWELVDKVCSPGGITVEGVISLQENGFQDSVTKAVDAVIQKDLSL